MDEILSGQGGTIIEEVALKEIALVNRDVQQVKPGRIDKRGPSKKPTRGIITQRMDSQPRSSPL